MKIFLKILLGLIIIFIVTGLFLDNKIDVRREVTIKALPQQIHPFINDLKNWSQWSPWEVLDPSIKTTFGDITSGTGASQNWTGESGSGALKFTQSSLEKGIVYDLTFEGDPTVYVSGMSYRIEGDTTIVTWYMQGEMGPIVIGNYFAQLMDALIGDSFQLGLDRLKEAVERQT
ncbi:SRPBCC family protein [Aliikangiella sp. G2MR2-5]|uniref:SRPBCC family protein n=1 Tax=Aliikangiella sp. G2MR2-5 TaxID=2788943 RepID=UPI0018A9DE6A|nr:SRPBCC family protein [Aliikangiella sp. G2MR2-5]